jgi:hypothetical protein
MRLDGNTPNPAASFPTNARSSENDLVKAGTLAVSRCAPTNPVASLAATISDTRRDGLPNLLGHTLWEGKLSHLKDIHSSLGDEFLNVEFGWKPLLSDIKDFVFGVKNMNNLIAQFVRDSGKAVRRRYSFSPVVTITGVPNWRINQAVLGPFDYASYMSSGVSGRTGVITRESYRSVSQWFSGSFTYHLPSDFFEKISGVGWLDRAVEQLGLDLNPSTLWEMTPWSWAIDWFGNVGDVLHNLNNYSSYGLVMKYGYIMEHSIARDTYSYSGGLGYRSDMQDRLTYPVPVTFCCETKLRRKATPYGFGFDMSSLSSMQKTILAALGLSRL